MKRPRAALYVRVSTPYKQHPSNQTAPLLKWCKEHAYDVAHTYIDRESGAEPERPQFKKMLAAAWHQEFDLILCWSLDRFSREGIAQTFIHLKSLQEAGVKFVSLTEEYFRTTGPAGDFLIAVTAWVADHERRRRQERIKAGMARAKENGAVFGRRPVRINPGELKRMQKMAARGRSLRAIAKHFHTSRMTVARRLRLARTEIHERRRPKN